MFNPVYTNRILKDIKLAQKRGLNLKKLKNVIDLLSSAKELPRRCKPHVLSGNYSNYWECHIEPDWLLIYEFTENDLRLIRTGTHSDLF
jgi:mRNA interferase YafQ